MKDEAMKEPTTTSCRADRNGTGSAKDGENRKSDLFRVSVKIRAGSAKGGKNRETLADIVAEMRKDCPPRHMDGTRYLDGDWVYTKGTVEKLADRIESAAKRGGGVWRAAFAKVTSVPRNCDVGTPQEQSARFDAHFRKHMGCLTCPLREKDGGVPKHCEFAWSQMPYEE